MNRSDLVNKLKDEEVLSRKSAETVVDAFFNAISETIADDQRVEIRGFGSFTVKKYKPYKGRNPKSGEKISVKPKKLPFFKVGKALKELVNS